MQGNFSSARRPSSDAVDQLRRLLETHAAGNARIAARLNDFVRDVSKEIGSGERPDSADLAGRWLDFNLAAFSVMSQQSQALFDGLLTAARDTLLPRVPTGSRRGTTAPSAELELTGRHGERLASGFIIENHFDQPLEVEFACGDLIAASEPSLPAKLVEFESPRLLVEPHGQAVARLAVVLTKDFVVGQTYRTTIRLVGTGDKDLGLAVTVLPPADGGAPRPTKRRRTREAAAPAASTPAPATPARRPARPRRSTSR